MLIQRRDLIVLQDSLFAQILNITLPHIVKFKASQFGTPIRVIGTGPWLAYMVINNLTIFLLKSFLVTPIVNYIFNENSGYSAADSAKNLGTAYFGIRWGGNKPNLIGPSSASNPAATSSDYFPQCLTDVNGSFL